MRCQRMERETPISRKGGENEIHREQREKILDGLSRKGENVSRERKMQEKVRQVKFASLNMNRI